jgi:hypothetical protein
MKNPEITQRWDESVVVQSQRRSDRSGSSEALFSLSLSLFSRLQLDDIHLEGYYYNVEENLKP